MTGKLAIKVSKCQDLPHKEKCLFWKKKRVMTKDQQNVLISNGRWWGIFCRFETICTLSQHYQGNILAQAQSLPRPDRHYFDRRCRGQFCVVFLACCFDIVAEVSCLYISKGFEYLASIVAWVVVENLHKHTAAEGGWDEMRLRKLNLAKYANWAI